MFKKIDEVGFTHVLCVETGFTLIELMIVVAIIGILAAISIPKMSSILEKSREGATKGNLSAIRSAVAIYYGDKEGQWPDDLTTNFSSYLSEIPIAKATPLGNSNAITLVTVPPTTTGIGWAYCSASDWAGGVWCNSTAIDSKGNSFTDY
ncbi:MAG: type II secretion system protein [Candidatus Firestonebacteria bacterium]